MKNYFISLLVVLTLLFSLSAYSVPKTNTALIFTLNGLSNLGVSNYQGGIGGKLGVGPFALRGSIGGDYFFSNGGTDSKNLFSTFGLLVDIGSTKTTTAYLGAEVQYDYVEPIANTVYGLAGVLGGEIFVMDNVSLGAESKVLINHNVASGTTNVTISNVTSNFLLNIYF